LLSSGNVVLDDYDDNDNVIGRHGASYETVFIERIVRDGLSTLFDFDETLPTNIILVPSLLDAHHECVFPQPPFGDRDEVKTEYFDQPLGVLNIPNSDPNDPVRRRVHLMPNPCMFKVNEVVFGVTSLDVLFALSSDEISLNVPGQRLDRLVAHMLQQHSFCPQFPMPQTTLSQVRLPSCISLL
jgi:DNA polymerase alpha subunit B